MRPDQVPNPSFRIYGDSTLYRNPQGSEESIATELCDGPLLDELPQDTHMNNATGVENGIHSGIDRDALIQRLKQHHKEHWDWSSVKPDSSTDSTLFEPLNSIKDPEEYNSNGRRDSVGYLDHVAAGLEIQRPRSALHSGDFSREELSSAVTSSAQSRTACIPISTSPPRPPRHQVPPVRPLPGQTRRSIGIAFSSESRFPSPPLSNDPSLIKSASPKYVLKPPTSPLVRGFNNMDREIDETPNDPSFKLNRRHTLTPLSPGPSSNDYSQLTAAARGPTSLRREETFPSLGLGHRSRKSLGSSWTYQANTSPSTPPNIHRRTPSFSSDASPRQSSMVGSYEESILRGRMSGMPSHPLTFEACIGALGKASCKPAMPAHVRIDFPAVFYSWNDGHGRVTSVNQEPSPYVGRIDLGNNLPAPRRRERRKRREDERAVNEDKSRATGDRSGTSEPADSGNRTKKRKYHKSHESRDAHSSDVHGEIELGGAYRIPMKGSLQLIIKNPNKTAVKVFIVPYSLEGMQPHQRTWVRQRLYSAGADFDGPIGSPTSVDISSRRFAELPTEKQTLRYLIHFKICCTGKDRFYLYDEVRVVFANRVPDNKEKLRSEVKMPEPKFMPFKKMAAQPVPDQRPSMASFATSEEHSASHQSRAASYIDTGAKLDFSSSKPLGAMAQLFGPSTPPTANHAVTGGRYDGNYAGQRDSMDRDRRELPDVDTEDSHSGHIVSPNREGWRKNLEEMLSSPEGSVGGKSVGRERGMAFDELKSSSQPDDCSDPFVKLHRNDVRYGGYFGRSGTPEPGEGLIARRLRNLMVDQDDKVEESARDL